MYVADNYGSKWVKGILNWFREKTLNGVKYDTLIIEATLECGLRRNKLIELVNEYIETGLLVINGDSVYWIDSEIKPSAINMGEKIPVKEESKPNITLQEKLTKYNEYQKNCITEKIKCLDYKTWLSVGMPISPLDIKNLESENIEI